MMFGRNKGSAEVVRRIPFGSVGVEIGVWKGDSSEIFLERASHLHMVDSWSVDAYRSSDEHGGFKSYLKRYGKLVGRPHESAFRSYYDAIYDSVVDRFADKPVTIHRCTSAEFFARTGLSVDWFYIDGSHSFDGCLADLDGALSMATYAIFGDDYGAKKGVTDAVNAFIEKTGLKLDVLRQKQYQIIL